MREEEFYGSWWTESDPETEVAGLLILDSDGLRLTLYGEWKDNASRGEDESGFRLVSEHHLRIFGFRHSDRKLVTLLDVRGRVMRTPVRTFGSRVYSVDMALVGPTLANSYSFNKVSFALDYLTAWTQPPPRTTRTPDDMHQLHLNTESRTLAECTTTDGYRVSLRNGLSGTEGTSGVSLEEYCAFDVKPPGPTERDILLDKMRMLHDFVTISLGRPVRVRWMYLYLDEPRVSFRVITRLNEPLESGDDLPDSRARNDVLDYQMPTLLTAKAAAGDLPLGVPLNVMLNRWSKLHPRATDVLAVLLSQYSTEDMLPHHRYSSLFSAVEEAHKALSITQLAVAKEQHQARRKRVASQLADCSRNLSEADANWLDLLIRTSRNDRSLSQKLGDIFAEAGELGAAAVRVAPNLFRNAARSRGQISHGTAGTELERAARTSYELVIEWTLRAVILSRLLNVRDRPDFFRAASNRHMFTLMLRRLAATEQ